MALETDPPHLGDIGDERERGCDDPLHGDDCNCGARPDSYEKL